MLKRVAFLICAVAMAGSAFAQQTKPSAPAKKVTATQKSAPADDKNQPTVAKSPVPPPLAVNVKVEVSITDQTGTNPPAKKVVEMIVGDQKRNSIRSSASVRVPSTMFGQAKPGEKPVEVPSYNYRNVTINVDAHPTIVQKEPNKLLLEFVLQYQPKSGGGQEDLEPGMASLNESMTLILESGKPTIVSQAADPSSDRKITVEVTATILK